MSSFMDAVQSDRVTRLTASRDLLARLIADEEIPAYRVESALKEMNRIADELEGAMADKDGDDIGEAASTPDEPWPAS